MSISKNSRITVIDQDGKRYVRVAKNIVTIGTNQYVLDDRGRVGLVAFFPGEGEIVKLLAWADIIIPELFERINELEKIKQRVGTLEKLQLEIDRLENIEIPNRKERVRKLIEEARNYKEEMKSAKKEVYEHREIVRSALKLAKLITEVTSAAESLSGGIDETSPLLCKTRANEHEPGPPNPGK